MDYGAIGLGVGIAGVIFAGLAWSLSSRALKYRMLLELMREYAHPDMNEHVKSLWYFWEDNGMNMYRMTKEYETLLTKRDKNKEDEFTKKITGARRQLSHFCQRMAALHEGHVLPDKLLFRLWSTKDLRIIHEVIMPLEKVHIKLIKNRQKTTKVETELEDNKTFELLTKLYEHSKGPGITII